MTKAERNSSFELLRIILIMLVAIEHVNVWYVGMPSELSSVRVLQCFVQSCCVWAVNCFVLISGWFGINGGYRRIFPLVGRILFCTIPLCVIFLLLGDVKINSIDSVYNYLWGGNTYWFIHDYIALVLLVPVLNGGFERIDKRTLWRMLLLMYAFILVMDFVMQSTVIGIEGGYSILWMAYLYLLGRYAKEYGIPMVSRYKWAILIGSIALEGALFSLHMIGTRYTNPLVLLPALSTLFIVKEYNFNKKWINYIAASSLVMYMLHVQPCLIPFIRETLCGGHPEYNYALYLVIATGFMIGMFGLAVLVNAVYKLIFNRWGLD